MVDNKSAIALMKNPVHHDRSKHIDVKYHFIRECWDRRLIDIEFVGTEHQLGDTSSQRRSVVLGFKSSVVKSA